jgi:hypothetical protein
MIFNSFLLGLLHAAEPDHVAVVSGVSLEQKHGAWKVGLAFGISHMLAVGILAVLTVVLGRTFLRESVFIWLDRGAWSSVVWMGLWNLAAALDIRKLELHANPHVHGGLKHKHPHRKGSHRFHHPAAWLGAFFGLGGLRGFVSLSGQSGISGTGPFLALLLLFGAGITLAFIALSAASGWLATRMGGAAGLRRGLFAVSGLGNVAVGLWLLSRG